MDPNIASRFNDKILEEAMQRYGITAGNIEILEKRTQALFSEDKGKRLRKSHENPDIQKLYAEFLGKPHSDLAVKLLHTKYVARPRI